MKLGQLMEGVKLCYMTADPSAEVTDVVNNSEKASKGTVFAALAGESDDGYGYIKDAVKRGCDIILCDRMPYVNAGIIMADDAREAYAAMCAHLYSDPQRKLKLGAVTGTNGKTTVTHMLHHIFSSVYGIERTALVGGVNNVICGKSAASHMTTPDPHEFYGILSEAVRGGAGYGFLEASSHALDYKKLTPCRFSVGVFTNLTEDHLDRHGTMENYFNSKKQLITLCDEFISNGDDEYTKTLGCPKFSLYNGDFIAKNVIYEKYGSKFEYRGSSYADIELTVPGRFNVYNALSAVAAAEIMGVSAGKSASALKSFNGAEGRFERIPCRNGADVIIDYAHTPDALEAALIEAKRLKTNKLYCVFGCGGDRDRQKRPVMGRIASKYADFTVITSDNSRSESPDEIIKEIMKGFDRERRYAVIADRREAILYALDNAGPGDTVLLAGKGHEKYEIRSDGYHPFSEKDIIMEYNEGTYRNDSDS